MRAALEILDTNRIVCVRTVETKRSFYKIEGNKGASYAIFEELVACPCEEFTNITMESSGILVRDM